MENNMIILIWLLELSILYDVVISLFSFRKSKIPTQYEGEQTATFTILIACHNEEEVIVDNLQALYDSEYNKRLFQVCVIADHCTDQTEVLCNEFKEKNKDFNMVVIPVKGGSKPKALNKGIDYLKQYNMWTNEYIVILDADNKVSPQLLSAFNYYHGQFDILQCRIRSANDESFIARSFTSAFNRTTYDRQISRNRVGLSASLSGTGFSIRRGVFDEIDFQHCSTLTEDLEFSVLAILKGYKIKFIEEQYVLNQHLDEFRPSIVQRIRWCRGHMQVSMKMTGKLMRAFIKRPSLQLIDTFLFINTPIRVLLFTVLGIYILMTRLHISYLLIGLSISILIYTIFYTVYCNNYDLSYVFNQFHYAISMYVAILYGTITYRSRVWVKTKHKKIQDVSQEKKSDKI